MSIECERAGGINLAQGICDTETPEVVRSAAQDAIEAGRNTYTRFDGIAEVRRAIAEKLASYNALSYDPDSEIVVSIGSTGAFHSSALALLDPGDEVVLFEPFYGYHLNTLLALGLEPRYVTMQPPDWTFAAQDLEAAITDKTKAIVVCSPSNPCGKVFTREEIFAVADVACRRDLFVFTDEIYEYFLYDGREHFSPARLAELADRTITISGYSKTFSITGWRIGYAAAQPRWTQAIGAMSDLLYVCAPGPFQEGVARGIASLPKSFYENLTVEYSRKRDRICGALRKAGLEPYPPQGAYYVLADATRVPGSSSKAKAMALLEATGVASVPGGAFYRGDEGETLLRFCFAKTDQDLDEACRRVERAAF